MVPRTSMIFFFVSTVFVFWRVYALYLGDVFSRTLLSFFRFWRGTTFGIYSSRRRRLETFSSLRWCWVLMLMPTCWSKVLMFYIEYRCAWWWQRVNLDVDVDVDKWRYWYTDVGVDIDVGDFSKMVSRKFRTDFIFMFPRIFRGVEQNVNIFFFFSTLNKKWVWLSVPMLVWLISALMLRWIAMASVHWCWRWNRRLTLRW